MQNIRDGIIRSISVGYITHQIEKIERAGEVPLWRAVDWEPLEISGVCSDGMLTCTKHIWQWDLNTGEPRGDAEKPLLCYPVRMEGTELWIDFDHELTYAYDD